MEDVEASRAKGSIKKMLLGNGGSASVRVGKTTRMLSHDSVIDRPLRKLPWPLSLLQPHTIRYKVYEEDKMVEEKAFKKRHINHAIRLFLDGLNPEEEVLFLPERGEF
jgi:hypothetical protein